MKKLMTILGVLLVSSTLFGQQLKTYSGKFDLHSYDVDVLGGINPGLLDGKATYTYYENENLQRIRSGKFNYSGKFSYNGTVTATISGNYKDGLKHGKWVVKQFVNSSGMTGNLSFNGDYKDGFPNGLWSSTISGTQKGKTITKTYTLNFSNNVINGDFKMIASGENASIKGSLDENGFYTGKTIVQEGGDEYQFTFNKGFLVSYIGRNLQSGNIFDNYKVKEEELNFFNLLMNEKDSSIIDEIPFKIVDMSNCSYTDSYTMLIDRLISNKFIDQMKNATLFDVTWGDLSINENNKYNWVGFKVRALEKCETKTERIARLKAEEAERIARLKAEEERLQKLEAERIARLKAEEAERIAQEKAEEVLNLNNKAWESLLKKDYTAAIAFCKKGIELDNENLYLKRTLAHGYLLIGDFENARKIYIENLDSILNNGTSWLKMIEMDFANFNSKDINSEGMERILYEVRMNKEEHQKYELLTADERYKQFKKNKKKEKVNKFLKSMIYN